MRLEEAGDGAAPRRVTASVTPMSRSGVQLQAAEGQGVSAKNWDKLRSLSRSGVLANLRMVLGEIEEFLGQDGTRNPSCHAPAPRA